MAIPTYDALYPSLLKSLADQKIHTNREIADFIASDMGISQRDRQEEVLSSDGGSITLVDPALDNFLPVRNLGGTK